MIPRKPTWFTTLAILYLTVSIATCTNSTTIHANVGDDVLLTCESSNAPHSCNWFFNGNSKIPDQNDIFPKKNWKQRNCFIRLINVRTEDSGLYQCNTSTMINMNSVHMKSTILIITGGRDFTAVPIVEGPESVAVHLHETVELKCIFSQAPPNCLWKKNSNSIYPDGEHMEFTNAPPRKDCSIRINTIVLNDNGFYQCGFVGIGQVPATESDRAEVTVLIAPNVPAIAYEGTEISHGEGIHVSEGQTNITAICTVRDGNPAAKIEWFLNGTSQGSSVFKRKPSNEPYLWTAISTLYLNITDNMGYEHLTCQSTHPAYNNMYIETYAVILIPAPVMTVQVIHNETGTESELFVNDWEYVSLICIADGEPAPQYTWDKLVDGVWTIITNGTANFTFRAEQGDFSCLARNIHNQYGEEIRSQKFSIQIIDTNGLNIGEIIGITIGCVGFLLIIVIAFICCYFRRLWCFKDMDSSSTSSLNNDGTQRQIVQENATNQTSENPTRSSSNSDNASAEDDTKPVYATIHGINKTRPVRSQNPVHRSNLEDPYLKQLETDYKDLDTPPSQKHKPKLRCPPSLSSDDDGSSLGSIRKASPHIRPISIVNVQNSTTSHQLRYIDLDLPETTLEYKLEKGEPIQYAIVKQQSDV